MRLMKAAFPAIVFTLLPAAAATQTRQPSNRPPTVRLSATPRSVTLKPCSGEDEPPAAACAPTSQTVSLSADASDPDGNRLSYSYTATGGSLSSDGANATLDLTRAPPGVYTVTVKVDDGRGGVASDTAEVVAARCPCDQIPPPPPPCPTVTMSCPALPVKPGTPITFTVNVSGGDPGVTPTFNWTVSAGTITGARDASSITVAISDALPAGGVTANAEVGGFDRSCETAVGCTAPGSHRPWPRKVDEYGVVTLGDEKARLNHVYELLQMGPTAQVYVICYGGRGSRAGEAERRCQRAREYLVTTRGIESSRVVTVDGGLREEPMTDVWFVPSGAKPPQPTPTVEPRAATPARTPRGAQPPRRQR